MSEKIAYDTFIKLDKNKPFSVSKMHLNLLCLNYVVQRKEKI